MAGIIPANPLDRATVPCPSLSRTWKGWWDGRQLSARVRAFSTGLTMRSRNLHKSRSLADGGHSGRPVALARRACSARMAASSASTFFFSSSVNTVAVRGGGIS